MRLSKLVDFGTFLLPCLWLSSVHVSRSSKRSNSLVRYINEISTKHQVIFLIDSAAGNQSTEIGDFMQKVCSNVPSVILTFDEMPRIRRDYKVFHNNSKPSTLFVIISNAEDRNFQNRLLTTAHFLTHITLENLRPNCLIVHLTENSTMNYEEILGDFWKEKFLDVMILQMVGKESGLEFKIRRRVATLYEFNPYSKIFTTRKRWSVLEWFPKKDNNLHRIEMKYVYVPGTVKPIFKLFGALSQKLNFNINLTRAGQRPPIGKISCNSVTGDYQALVKNKAQFVAVFHSYYHKCRRTLLRRSHIYYLEEMLALIPRSPVNINIDIISWEFFNPILTNVIAIISLYLIMRFMKFNKKIWRPLNIFELVLGNGLPADPEKLKEKIGLICFLFIGIVYSGYIHSLLTEIQVKEITVKEISTVQEFLESNLSVFTNRFLFSKIDFPNRKKYVQWLTYTNNVRNTHNLKKCLKVIVEYKNISCVLKYSTMVSVIEDQLKTYNKLNMKLMKEPLSYAAFIFWMEPGAPYGENIDREILNFVSNGLMHKWELYPSQMKIPFVPELPVADGSSHMYRRVFFLLIFGHLLATIVFIGEILVSAIKK